MKMSKYFCEIMVPKFTLGSRQVRYYVAKFGSAVNWSHNFRLHGSGISGPPINTGLKKIAVICLAWHSKLRMPEAFTPVDYIYLNEPFEMWCLKLDQYDLVLFANPISSEAAIDIENNLSEVFSGCCSKFNP